MPEKRPVDPDEAARWEANDRRVHRLYEELETILKRHNPVDYAVFVSSRLREIESDPGSRGVSQTPPHRLIHSVEACCAYSRRQNHDPLTQNRFARVMNAYHEFSDPRHQDALVTNGSLDEFMLLLHREQMELQYIHTPEDIGRDWILFGDNPILVSFSEEFRSRHSLAPVDFLRLCYVAGSLAMRAESNGVFRTEWLRELFRDVSDAGFLSFLSLTARSPEGIGRRFAENRKDRSPYFQAVLRSAIFETPIMDMGGGNLLVLKDRLVFRHASECLYRSIKARREFLTEFAKGFADHAARIADSFPGVISIHNGTKLEKMSPGKSCDLLIEMADAILLVEIKAVRFTPEMLTVNSLQNDNSTTKITDGYLQTRITENDLGDGVFDSLVLDKSKPLQGVVVSYGEVPHVNSDWYFDSVLLPAYSKKVRSSVQAGAESSRRPVSMSIRSFERLVMCSHTLGRSPFSIVDEKSKLNFVETGDFDIHLPNLMRPMAGSIYQIPYLRSNERALFASLGLSEDELDQLMSMKS